MALVGHQERKVESHKRLVDGLRASLGPEILLALEDPRVVEIMLDPTEELFVERLGSKIEKVGTLSASDAESVIGTVAHALGTEVTVDRPIISGELPLGGHRFEGLLPPTVALPTFTIRKKTSLKIQLGRYIQDGTLSQEQADFLRQMMAQRKNIIVSGGTGSGKTTFVNALLAELVDIAPDDRLLILEDTKEIQCYARTQVPLHTTDCVDISRLLKSALRLRPDRIIVGEVRDGAALSLLKAWNTGHPGGIATLHANSAALALRRLEQLVAEVTQKTMKDVIGDAVDVVIHLKRTATGRKVEEILMVTGVENEAYKIYPWDNREGTWSMGSQKEHAHAV
jgi:type IV secretion system protein TrbB